MQNRRQFECPHCNGTGQVIVMEDQRDGVPLGRKPLVTESVTTRRCGWCGGDGEIDTTDHPEHGPTDTYTTWCASQRPDLLEKDRPRAGADPSTAERKA